MKTKEPGRLYSSRGRTTVICTGPGLTDEMFAGFVFSQTDPESGHPRGYYSTTWANGAFEEDKDDESFTLLDVAQLFWHKKQTPGTAHPRI